MITLKSIAIKNTSRANMQELGEAEVSVEKGVSGDFRGTAKDRQVTVLSDSAWQKACDELDVSLPWTTRRANLLVSGIEFSAQDVGKKLRIGDVVLNITRETNPCDLMDQQKQGLTEALTPEWRGGVCCNVVKPGRIRVGDRIEVD